MKVSVVIPALTDQETITRTVNYLAREPNAIHEVIVVDDGSDPPLKPPGWVHLIRIDRDPTPRTAGVARNTGARRATGTHLLFCDASVHFPPDAVHSMTNAAAFADIVDGGWSKTMFTARWIGLKKGFRFEVAPEDYDAAIIELGAQPDLGYINPDHQFSIIRRDWFWRLGGYDEVGLPSWGFDCQDLSLRIWQAGGDISSAVRRFHTNQRLYIVHEHHEHGDEDGDFRDTEARDREFIAKWGELFSKDLIKKVSGIAIDQLY